MKKSKNPLPPTRPLYALLLVAAALLLWLLTRPRPGVRVKTLRPVLAPAQDIPAPARPRRIRIATYNLEHFSDARNDGPERTPETFVAQARGAAGIIAEAGPDILLLQEVENGRALEFLNDQFETPYPYVYVTKLRQSSGEHGKLNLALLARLPPLRVRQIAFHDLSGPGRPSRGTLAAEFDLGDGGRLIAYNIHLKSNYGDAPSNRAKRGIALHHLGADALAETLRNAPRPTSVVILGDTNVDPDSPLFADDPSLEPLAGAYVDLWSGRPIEERTTINTRLAGSNGDTNLVFPPAAFDRVFVSRDLTNAPWKAEPPQTIPKGTVIHDNSVLPGVDGHVSDHYLVYVDLVR